MRATLSSRGWHTTSERQRKRKGSERKRDENAEQIETGSVRRSDPFVEEESRTRHVIRYILSSFLARVRFAKQRAPNAVLSARTSVSPIRSRGNRYRDRSGPKKIFFSRETRDVPVRAALFTFRDPRPTLESARGRGARSIAWESPGVRISSSDVLLSFRLAADRTLF